MTSRPKTALQGRPTAIIDAHHHFWDLRNDLPWLKHDPVPFRYGDYSAISRDYLPQDYRNDTADWPIVGSVYVEAEWNRALAAEETLWVSHIAEQAGLPSVMVSWCDLASPAAAELLAKHSSSEIVRGVRHKPAAAPSPQQARRGAKGSMDDPKWREGYAHLKHYGWSYDLQTPWWHLDAACDLASDFPDIPLIINHSGLPADRSSEGLAGWRKALETAATRPNVFMKISGLGQLHERWNAVANIPIIRDIISIFSVDRAMFASNFPVDSLVGNFDTIFSGFVTATADLSEEDRAKLFCDNAARVYRLPHALAKLQPSGGGYNENESDPKGGCSGSRRIIGSR